MWRSVQSGTLESLQVSTQGAGTTDARDRIADAHQKLADLETHLGPKHPECIKAAMEIAALQKEFDAARLNIARRVETEYRQAMAREQMLQKEFQQTKAEFDQLNSRSFQYARSSARPTPTARSTTSSSARSRRRASTPASRTTPSTWPTPPGPTSLPSIPIPPANVVEAFLIALVLGIAAALLSDKVDSTIRDPEQARSFLGAEVVATLPLVRGWRGKLVKATRAGIRTRRSGRTIRGSGPHAARFLLAGQRAEPAEERDDHQRLAQ